jgi:ABC-type uncharacterized transport system substrate-binding protein
MKIIYTALILLFSLAAFAHPHVWLDSRMYIGGGVIKMNWTFDKMFSNVILSDFDIDKDKQLVGREASQVKENMFDNLQYFDYFVIAYCGTKPVPVDGAKNFAVSVKDGRVSYAFDVVLGRDCKGELKVYSYDTSNYTDISIMEAKGAGVVIKEDTGGMKYAAVKQ